MPRRIVTGYHSKFMLQLKLMAGRPASGPDLEGLDGDIFAERTGNKGDDFERLRRFGEQLSDDPQHRANRGVAGQVLRADEKRSLKRSAKTNPFSVKVDALHRPIDSCKTDEPVKPLNRRIGGERGCLGTRSL